jgi:hypothetical protein
LLMGEARHPANLLWSVSQDRCMQVFALWKSRRLE